MANVCTHSLIYGIPYTLRILIGYGGYPNSLYDIE